MKLELKLELYSIHGNLLSWMESFLTRRVQTIICEGATSPSSQVTSGVPRKSVLGTLLFLTDINNLRKSYFCFVLLVHWRRVKCISSFLCCDLLLFEIIFFCSSIHWRTLKDRGQPWLVYWMLIRLMQQSRFFIAQVPFNYRYYCQIYKAIWPLKVTQLVKRRLVKVKALKVTM